MQTSLPFESFEPSCSDAPRLKRWSPEEWNAAQDWQPMLKSFFSSNTGQSLGAFVQQRIDAGATVFPPQPLRAFELTAKRDVHVVIIGQDPYHGAGQAEGLAFSVSPGVKIPPSLRNIFKELNRDLGLSIPKSGSLVDWAKRGVLLLNTSLTVEEAAAASHAKRGWETLADSVVSALSDSDHPIVFMLWGAHAQARRELIDESNHLVLASNHPSPLSATRPPEPFIGCGHFGIAQRWLAERGVNIAFDLPGP